MSSSNISDLKAPPVDLNKPVENPRLVAAIERLLTDQSVQAKDALLVELNRANFLAVIFTDEMHSTPPDENGHVTIKEKSLIKVLSTTDSNGNVYLPLFTDWNAIGKYVGEKPEKPISTLVLPAADAWSWALAMGSYQGVVINPAHNALPLNRQQIEYLAKQHEGK